MIFYMHLFNYVEILLFNDLYVPLTWPECLRARLQRSITVHYITQFHTHKSYYGNTYV